MKSNFYVVVLQHTLYFMYCNYAKKKGVNLVKTSKETCVIY